jgi:sulfatase maturation enzyme AslB (radical SAM superfamily)
MEFSGLNFTLTDDCDYNCSYCYQKKGKWYIAASKIEKAVDFFYPFLTDECYVNFYGGEPLLAYEQIQQSVSYILKRNREGKKHVRFSLNTNGGLIDDHVLEFLTRHEFILLLSFDGLTQDIHRKKGSFVKTVSLIDKILENSNIELRTNSVFTPDTIPSLSQSLRFIAEKGVPSIDFSLSRTSHWDLSALHSYEKELSSLRIYMTSLYKESGNIPLIDFRKNSRRGIFGCFAGQDRMAITPDGLLWGCCHFPDYISDKKGVEDHDKYCFGDLDAFIKNHEKIYPQILSNYSDLRMYQFFTPADLCLQCEEFDDCGVCPIDTAVSGVITKRIPLWMCKEKKIFRKEKKRFWEDLDQIHTNNKE